MTSDLSAIAVLLPQPLLDRLETLRQSRNLASIQEAVLIALSDYFASQSNASKPSLKENSSPIEARLARTEALLTLLSDRLNRLEGHSLPRPPIADISDDIEDEPDEVLQSFLEPERQFSFPETAKQPPEGRSTSHYPVGGTAQDAEVVSFGQNLGWVIQPNGKVQPLAYEEIEEEPDEILYDFLDQ
ncbi:hypothetical protein [Leptolyngbya sp. FACHB-711]|uniref:hypothetical protein n=1 Tax=unclassified Leptolyngbya TaxID=2650499 RepID=UPI0016888C4D|nr:hypothetical protein [Leptolyngbya sp. FACHB-711]MBD1850059.1 hypothetical protein [Cyanobacteria bacterium FACHB-502]MBD2024779.1 hypothetical protein [Leptolyngbya sp. FACHB-711]